MKVVALGGGHGLAVTLTALRLLGVEPTAVVAVADDGGSSGRLRRDLGLLPPGDLRKALLALADPAAEARELFAYRFERGDLAGHNLGNLTIAALADLRGGFLEGLAAAATWLRVRGRVEGVWLDPPRPDAVPAAVEAVRSADLVLLGPGSTFTSVVPNLLVPELGRAVAAASDRVVYVCNLEAQQGETSGFPPEGHLAAILAHCPELRVAQVLCQQPSDAAAADREVRAFGELGARVVHAEVAAADAPGRHDPARLAAALKELG